MVCEDLPIVLDIRRRPLRKPTVWRFGQVGIRTEATPCHLDGERHWLLCPACGRRCTVIYRGLRCRLCLGAHYRSEHLSPSARELHRIHKLRRRLGQEPGTTLALPPRPRDMHWSTWLRRRKELEALVEEHILGTLGPFVMRTRRRK